MPPEIIRRLPVRFTYDNNYFRDPYQGIPQGGYTPIIEKLLSSAEVQLGVDFNKSRDEFKAMAKKVLYTFLIIPLGDLNTEVSDLKMKGLRLTIGRG